MESEHCAKNVFKNPLNRCENLKNHVPLFNPPGTPAAAPPAPDTFIPLLALIPAITNPGTLLIRPTAASVKAAPMSWPICNVKKDSVKRNVFAKNNLQIYA